MSASTVDRKVAAGGVGGAFAVVCTYILGQLHIQPTPELAVALTAIFTFILQYFIPNKEPAE